MPLLQCSFLAFACTLSAILLNSHQLSGMQYVLVLVAAAYYTAMLMLWTAPSVLHAKVVAEESFEAATLLGGENDDAELIRSNVHGQPDTQNDETELEDLRATCEELRALLQRERHNHSVEARQLQEKLRDQEGQTRKAEHERVQAAELASRLTRDMEGWRACCTELSAKPVPRPSASGEPAGQGGQPLKQHEDTGVPEPSHASSSGDNGSTSDAEGSQPVDPDSYSPPGDLIEVHQSVDSGGLVAAVTDSSDAEPTNASQEQQLLEVQKEPQEVSFVVPISGSTERIAATDENEQTGVPVLDACAPDSQTRLHEERPPPPPLPLQHEIPTNGTTEDEDFGTPQAEQRETRPQSDEGSDTNPPLTECGGEPSEDLKATEAEAADRATSGEDDALLMGEPGGTAD